MFIRRFGFPQICYQAPDAPGGGGGTPAAASPASAPAAAPSASPSPPASSTPAPAAAPAVPSSEPAASTDEGASAFDFGTILGEDVIEAPLVTPAAPVVPGAPVVAPAPAAPATAQPVAQPTAPVAPAAPVAPQTGPQDARPLLNPTEPFSLADAMQQNEAPIIDHIANTVFKLSPEEVEALNENAVEVIPRLMAKSFFQSQQNMYRQLGRLIPAMITRHMDVVKRSDSHTQKFYDRWKDIDRATHEPLVNRFAYTYRQMNPSATLEQMVEDVGLMVMTAAKIQPKTPGAPQAAAPMAPVANGVRPPQPTPFQPASGGVGVIPPGAPEDNPWQILAGDPLDQG